MSNSSNQWGKTENQEQAYDPFGESPFVNPWVDPPVEQPEPEAKKNPSPPWYVLKWLVFVMIMAFGIMALVAFMAGFFGAAIDDLGGAAR